LSEAERAGDRESLAFSKRTQNEFASNFEFEFVSGNENQLRQISAGYDRGQQSSRIYLEDGRSDSLLTDVPSPIGRPHLQAFLGKYGDLMRFPIHPEIADPHVHLLEVIFTSRPAKIVPPEYKDWPNDLPSKCPRYLVIEVNENYSNDTIADCATQEIRSFLKSQRRNINPEFVNSSGRTESINWEKLNTALRVWDLRNEGGRTDVEIGKIVYPNENMSEEDVATGASFDERIRNRVRKGFELVEDKIKMFER
jgi:hypothetical protein